MNDGNETIDQKRGKSSYATRNRIGPTLQDERY